MSPPDHQSIDLDGTGSPPNPPKFADSSGPLFFMYRNMAEEEDNKMAERWQKDAEGILVFTGLFSAAVAALVAVTVQDLKQNPQDTSAFYLENIYQLLADPNVSRSSILSTPAKPLPFSPPKYAIWVNSLWFLTLAISLTCAMLATLLQQWARRYLKVTQPLRDSPHDRARIRAFFSHGVERFHLSWAVEVLPTLIHLSLFLFFTGLLIYLFNIHHTVFRAVAWWVGVSTATYLLITFVPIFRPESPYRTPLSSLAWYLYAGISYIVLLLFWCFVCCCNATFQRIGDLKDDYRKCVLEGLEKTIKKIVQKSSPELDRRLLKWTFDSLAADHEQDQFFRRIPGFCSSKVVENPHHIVEGLDERELSSALVEFLDHTWSSNLVSGSDKIQRTVTCVKVAEVAHLHLAVSGIVRDIFTRDQRIVLRSIDLGRSLRSRSGGNDWEVGLLAQTIVAGIIANVPQLERDEHWTKLALDQLGDGSQRYLDHGHDSVLFANLIHITRQIVTTRQTDAEHRNPSHLRQTPLFHWTMSNVTLPSMLPSLSNFNIQNTLPELQRDFCSFWNRNVQEAQDRGSGSKALEILRHIRHIYIRLHQSTHAPTTAAFSASNNDDDNVLHQPSSYPICDIDHYHPNSTPHVH